MSDIVSRAELDGQHAELLPARTVLSVFSSQIPVGDAESTTSSGSNSGANRGGDFNFYDALNFMRSGTAGSNADGTSGASNS